MATTTLVRIGVTHDGYSRQVHTEDGPDYRWTQVCNICAEASTGHRWVLLGFQAEGANAEAEANEVLKALDHDPVSRPDAWGEIDPCYGSEAWGEEDEYRLACFEADCFGEPRPRW